MTKHEPVGEIFTFNGKQLPIREAYRVGGVLYLSGQLGFDENGAIVGDDIVSQTHQTIANIEAVLSKAGCSRDDIFKATVWLQNIEDFPAFNGVYAEYFGENPPVRSTVRADLMAPGALVEIEVQAVIDRD